VRARSRRQFNQPGRIGGNQPIADRRVERGPQCGADPRQGYCLQDAGTTCPKGTTAISWNQQGPAGSTGSPGRAGADGNTILNGTGAPPSGLGNNGGFCLDTAADLLYGPEAGGTWPATGPA
jgi:hypothetical protein